MIQHFLTLVFLLSASLSHAANPEKISIPESISEQFETFEPSACTYLPDLNLFLVASDDTDEEDRPFLFLMNEKGELADKPIKVQGLSKMTDIESMSVDSNGTLYLLSSLGLNKNGKEKPERNVFARATRKGTNIRITDHIQLRSLLLDALESSHIAEDFESELDVEASFIKEGELYVGLKNPQPKSGKALILNLGSVDKLFSQKKISHLSVWKTIDFGAVTGEANLLSDMVLSGNTLLMTTTAEEGPGHLWSYSITHTKLSLLDTFNEERPEGLSLRQTRGTALILFDQGEEAPLYKFAPLSAH